MRCGVDGAAAWSGGGLAVRAVGLKCGELCNAAATVDGRGAAAAISAACSAPGLLESSLTEGSGAEARKFKLELLKGVRRAASMFAVIGRSRSSMPLLLPRAPDPRDRMPKISLARLVSAMLPAYTTTHAPTAPACSSPPMQHTFEVWTELSDTLGNKVARNRGLSLHYPGVFYRQRLCTRSHPQLLHPACTSGFCFRERCCWRLRCVRGR